MLSDVFHFADPRFSYACRDLIDDHRGAEPLIRLGVLFDTLPRFLSELFEAYQTALTAAQWLTKPQMRVLFSITVMIPDR